MITIIKHPQLLPVIELEPFDYRNEDSNYTSPGVSSKENPGAWEEYNQRCYSDAGLTNLKPIQKGSWFFEITRLSINNLRIILPQLITDHLESIETTMEDMLDNLEEYAPLISGGMVVVFDEQVLSIPGCCCGLEAINEWTDSLFPFGSNKEIWVGHDGPNEEWHIQYDTDDDLENMLITIAGKGTYQIELELYERLIKNTRRKINRFITKAAPLLDDIFQFDQGKRLLRGMIYRENG